MWIHSSAWLAILVGEHVATADMVGRTDQPFLFHPLDQARGAVIADAQLPLQPARRSLLAFGDDLAGLGIHAVFGAVAAGGGALHRKAAVLGSSEGRRVGKEGVSTCSSRWGADI